jgi:hypothetical protein
MMILNKVVFPLPFFPASPIRSFWLMMKLTFLNKGVPPNWTVIFWTENMKNTLSGQK